MTLACRILCILLLPFLLAGCFAYSPARIRVIDAETHKPVPNASVRLLYSGEIGDITPHGFHGITNNQGEIILPIAQSHSSDDVEALPSVLISAPGYLDGSAGLYIPLEHFRQHRATAPNDPLPIQALVYADIPTWFEVTVPVGFRGLIHLRSDGSHPAVTRTENQRTLTFALEPNNILNINNGMVTGVDAAGTHFASHLLKSFNPMRIRAPATPTARSSATQTPSTPPTRSAFAT